MSERYVYPGDGAAVDAALAEFGVEPGAANRVRALHPFKVLTSLLSQACHGEPAHAPAIVAEAEKHLATLRAAVRAAESVVAEARAGLGLDPAPPAPPPRPRPPRPDR